MLQAETIRNIMKTCTLTNRTKEVIKKYRFLIAILIAAFIKQLLVVHLPIYALPTAEGDDNLFLKWANSILSHQWLGDYDRFTFMKTAGFSIYLAVCKRLGLSYIMTTNIIYSIGCIMFIYAMNPILKSRKALYAVYLIILFNPASFALDTLQRVYRSGLGMGVTLIVFACFFQLYFHLTDPKVRKTVCWALLAGISMGYLWILKSDSLWLLPFMAVLLSVCLGILVKKRNKELLRYIALLLPVLGVILISTGHNALNTKYYGTASITYYKNAAADMLSVDTGESQSNISLTRETFRKLCELSPTLSKAQAQMESQLDFYDSCDTHPDDGEVEDGWIEWAIICGVSDAGYYQDAAMTNDFYRQVYDELEQAYDNGSLQRKESGILEQYCLDSAEHIGELLHTMGQAFWYMAGFADTKPQMELSQDNGTIDAFEDLTHDVALYGERDYDYNISGWIVLGTDTLDNYQIYIVDSQKKKCAEVTLADGSDVIVAYPKFEGETVGRYDINWDVSGDDKQYYMQVYHQNVLQEELKIGQDKYEMFENTEISGCVDSYYAYLGRSEFEQKAENTVERLSAISSGYQYLGRMVFVLGLAGYLIHTISSIRRFRRKDYDALNAWLVQTAILLSLVVFTAGMAVTQLTKCETIKCMYLSAGYAPLLSFSLVSILLCIRLFRKDKQKS